MTAHRLDANRQVLEDAPRKKRMKRQALFLTVALLAVSLLPNTVTGEPQAKRGALVGKWMGRISSMNFASFEVTIDVSSNAEAHVVGNGSPCFTEAELVVTVSDSNVVTLAGRSKAGENVTFKGMMDSSGKELDLTYIANGSSNARCETDQGAGTLDKQ
jgi:hypothetical protein